MQFIHDNKKKISNDFIYSVCTCTSVMKNIQSGRKGGISNITLQLVIILNMDNIQTTIRLLKLHCNQKNQFYPYSNKSCITDNQQLFLSRDNKHVPKRHLREIYRHVLIHYKKQSIYDVFYFKISIESEIRSVLISRYLKVSERESHREEGCVRFQLINHSLKCTTSANCITGAWVYKVTIPSRFSLIKSNIYAQCYSIFV